MIQLVKYVSKKDMYVCVMMHKLGTIIMEDPVVHTLYILPGYTGHWNILSWQLTMLELSN